MGPKQKRRRRRRARAAGQSKTKWTLNLWKTYGNYALRGTDLKVVKAIPGSASRKFHTRCHTCHYTLSDSTNSSQLPAFGKRHTPSTKQLMSLIEGASRSPSKLHADEVRNTTAIDTIVKPNVSGVVPLTNGLLGENTSHRLKVFERFSFDHLAARIKGARTPSERIAALRQGVMAVARLDGYCTRFSGALLKFSPEFVGERDQRQAQNLELIGSRLKHLSTDSHFDPTVYINDLRKLGIVYDLEEIFGHGDFNLEHVRAGPDGSESIKDFLTVIDLEDFGLYSHVEDICDALMIRGVGTRTIIRHEEFPALLERYLALEHAYRVHGDDAVANEVASYENGVLQDHLRSEVKLNDQYFADFVLGFHAHAIQKLLQFSVAHVGEAKKYCSEIGQLYHTIAGRDLDDLFETASDTGKAREQFYVMGMMLNDSGVVEINPDDLETIRNGASRVFSNRIALYAPGEE
tara:strand:+ start:1406 stop:2794 length:1389 start_codon:yes stop_codon:yes gene_type:complete